MNLSLKADELIDGIAMSLLFLYAYVIPRRERTSSSRTYAYNDITHTYSWSSCTASNSSYFEEFGRSTGLQLGRAGSGVYPVAQLTGITPDYDFDGNMERSETPSNDGVTTNFYAWNGENRMITASNSSMTASYNYDYMGRRFEKVVRAGLVSAHTTFIYDGWNLIQEVGRTVPGEPVTTNQYIWGLDLSQSLQGAGGIGGLLCVIENGTPYYPFVDGNGNITDYVDTNGTVVAHYEYGPFGQIIAKSGTKADDFKFRFSSKYFDDETGLYYYGLRYYNSAIGRWPSRDPIGEIGGMNLYGFVGNRPVSFFDAIGLKDNRTRRYDPCKCGDEKVNLAAKLWLGRAAAAMNKDRQRRERCGRLCCNKETKEVTSTGYATGVNIVEWVLDEASGRMVQQWRKECDPKWAPKCSTLGDEYELAGYYHTHPDRDNFSPEDRAWIRAEAGPFFVWTGDEDAPIRRLDPALGPPTPPTPRLPVPPPNLADPIESIIGGDGSMEPI